MFAVVLRHNNKEQYLLADGNKEVVFGSGKNVTVKIADAPEFLLAVKFRNSRVIVTTKPGRNAPETEHHTNELIFPFGTSCEVSLYVSVITGVSSTSLVLPYSGLITVGRREDNDIILGYPIISGHHFKLSLENGNVHVTDLNSTNNLYLNGDRIDKAVMKSGDVLSIYTFRFQLKNGSLFFENIGSAIKFSEHAAGFIDGKKKVVASANNQAASSGKYLSYHLSPRIREEMPSEPIYLAPVPEQAKAFGGSRGNMAYLLGSGAMMAASLASGFVSPVMLLARLAGMISPVANMASYNKLSKEEKKQLEEYEQLRQTKYREYVADQKAKIVKIANIQRKILTVENQSPIQCLETVDKLKRNLWERMPTDNDFLTTRLGIGNVKLCVEVKTKREMDEFMLKDDDELETIGNKIIEETRLVDNSPVCIPLGKLQTVGIIGTHERLVYMLRAMLVELSALHNPADVKFVFLADKQSLGRWGVLRWLPHIWDETKQVRYISFDDVSRHTICDLLEDIIRKRKEEVANTISNDKSSHVLPHYIVIAENRDLICHETIYEDLTSNNPSLGISTIVLADDLYGLPQKCQLIIEAKDRPCVYYKDQHNDMTMFEMDENVHQKDMESYARRISAIELESAAGEIGIPNSVTFLQGYKANNVAELNIFDRWENSEPYRTLAAPIGVMNGGKYFSLDVMSGEGAHGPHGLLAGTTGSGKSELLQTWILSMAVNYHPHDVNFVIIDYKGGGMSDLMEPLPHVVGKITNIDRNINRSLVALKSELKRRQELFAKAGVNSIGKYQRAYKNHETDVPLPHLIIVTDEFAEMKKEEPEFMTELNSVATIGRSLGIHMLLATQKPAGVVTDQINSNSRFRICMKVQDVSDSREMLKRPDAAKITQSGRAYYRIGEDEDFGLFQSFYSGAEYIENKKTLAATENQVRIVGVTGDRIKPVSKSGEKKSYDKDELSAVVEEINRICAANNIVKMPGPWLPELPKWLPLNKVFEESDCDIFGYKNVTDGIRIPIGMYDVPERQIQGISYLNLSEVGHCGIYGEQGTGKTVFLKTLITSIAYLYRSSDVNINILDANRWTLSEFSKLPHVKNVILNQDTDGLNRFVANIRRELNVRREAFVKNAVNSLAAYRTSVNSDLPAIVIVVDNIFQLFDDNIQVEEALTEIATSGSTYGIHLVFTAINTSRYKFIQLIKAAIALQLPDKGDYLNIVGRLPSGSVPVFPGRAVVKGNPPVSVQLAVYLDYADVAESQKKASYKEDIEKLISDVVESEDRYASEQKTEGASAEVEEPEQNVRSSVLIGTDINTLDKVYADLSSDYSLLISGENDPDSRNIIDSVKKRLEYRSDCQLFDIDENNYEESIAKLVELLGDRKKRRKEQVFDEEHTEEKWLSGYMQLCIVMDDVSKLIKAMSDNDKKTLRRIISLSSGLGVVVIARCDRSVLNESESDMLCSVLRESKNVIGTVSEPSDFPFLRSRIDNSAWIGLDKGEAFVLSGDSLKVVSILKEGT